MTISSTITNMDSEILVLIETVRKDPRFKYLKCVFGVGKYGGLLAKCIATELDLNVVNHDQILLYPTREILVVGDQGADVDRYRKFSYWVQK